MIVIAGVLCCCPAIIHGQILVLSPFLQFEQGTPAQDVKCRPNFQLVLKAEDKSPACINPKDVSEFIKRGWALNYTAIAGKEWLSLATEPVERGGNFKNGTMTMDRTIDVNIDNFKQSNSSLVLKVYGIAGKLYKTDTIGPDTIQPDGFYKYALHVSSDSRHFYGYYKVVATYDGSTAVTYAPAFVPP